MPFGSPPAPKRLSPLVDLPGAHDVLPDSGVRRRHEQTAVPAVVVDEAEPLDLSHLLMEEGSAERGTSAPEVRGPGVAAPEAPRSKPRPSEMWPNDETTTRVGTPEDLIAQCRREEAKPRSVPPPPPPPFRPVTSVSRPTADDDSNEATRLVQVRPVSRKVAFDRARALTLLGAVALALIVLAAAVWARGVL